MSCTCCYQRVVPSYGVNMYMLRTWNGAQRQHGLSCAHPSSTRGLKVLSHLKWLAAQLKSSVSMDARVTRKCQSLRTEVIRHTSMYVRLAHYGTTVMRVLQHIIIYPTTPAPAYVGRARTNLGRWPSIEFLTIWQA